MCSGERQIPAGYNASAPHRLSSPAESVICSTHVLRACAAIYVPGIAAHYTDTATNRTFHRLDQTIQWMAPHYGDVPHPSLTEAAPFAVRWTGFMNVSAAALYTFQPGVLSPAEWGQSDRVRLWVDNQLLIDQWSSLSNTFPLGYTEMGPGSLYQLKMEYKCENSYPNNTYGCQYMLPMPPAVRFVSHAGAGLS